MRTGRLALGACAGAIVLGLWISSRGPIRAETAGDTDVLKVLFGEARTAISLSLFDRADVYFHGGVTADDCDHNLGRAATGHGDAEGHGAEQGDETDADPDHGHDADGHEVDHADHEHAATAMPTLAELHWDLWSYLNSRVHPREHRHLAGSREEQEVLPWLWAAARVDPHNILAYEVGAYWLARRLKRVDEALRFIRDGIRNNPESADLEFCRGEILLAACHDLDGAAAAFLEARRKWQPGTTQEEKEDNQFMLARNLMYLADIYAKQGNPDRAREYYRETLTVIPGHALATQKLRALATGGR